jgi:hypothetical protein
VISVASMASLCMGLLLLKEFVLFWCGICTWLPFDVVLYMSFLRGWLVEQRTTVFYLVEPMDFCTDLFRLESSNRSFYKIIYRARCRIFHQSPSTALS